MTEIELIKLNVHGITNSFRIPFHMTVHDTLNLPPKTTVIGMIAAALGYKRCSSDIENLYSNTLIGISGSYISMYYDLISIYKLKDKAIKSQLQRQINYNNRYTIYIKNNAGLDDIYEKLKNPVYALSLGKAHEIINILSISKIKKELITSEYIHISNTVVPFEIDDFDICGNSNEIIPFISVEMPLSFSVDNGYREPENFCKITQIMNLKIKIKRPDYKIIHDDDYDTDIVLQ